MEKRNTNGWTAFRRRRLIGSVLLLALLIIMTAACGTNGNLSSANKDAAPEATSSANSSKTGTEPEESVGKGTKSVHHLFGDTDIPAEPKRIVSLGLEDMLLSLEVPLVQANGMEGYYLYDKLQSQNIPLLYAAGGLNYEEILSAQPDLIFVLGGLVPDQATYDKLSQIAPTLVYDRDDWKNSIVEIGGALGLEDKAQEVIKAYDATLAQAKEKIVQAVGTDKTVALLRPSDKDIQVFFPRFAYGSVLYNDLGLSPSKGVKDFQNSSAADISAGSLSLEEIPKIDADYVFVTAGGSLSLQDDFQKAQGVVSKVEELQLWKSLPAVKQNHVVELSARHWMLSGPIADSMKIADVVAAVTGTP